MRIYSAPEQLLCQVFPTTLQGPARIWFHSLKEGEISNFTELARLFIEQFVASKRIIPDPSHLSGIRQIEGETLKDFFGRFTTEARKIPGVNTELLRGVFLGALQPGRFHSTLMRETTPTYLDLIRRVEAQIAADEAIETHQQQFGESSKRKRNQKLSQDFERSCEHRKGPRQNRGTLSRQEYTPLNTTRANILLAINDNDDLRRPKLLTSNRGNQSQYCDFHRGYGHRTEGCNQLKDEIERLIQRGLLRQFLQ